MNCARGSVEKFMWAAARAPIVSAGTSSISSSLSSISSSLSSVAPLILPHLFPLSLFCLTRARRCGLQRRRRGAEAGAVASCGASGVPKRVRRPHAARTRARRPPAAYGSAGGVQKRAKHPPAAYGVAGRVQMRDRRCSVRCNCGTPWRGEQLPVIFLFDL